MDDGKSRKHRIFGIQRNELLLVLLFYFVFGNAYQLAYFLTNNGNNFFFSIVAIDYTLKALLTIPIWYLLFRQLAHWSLFKKVLLHFVLLPIYVICWQNSFYAICDSLDVWHLSDAASWWDVYITSLFYVLQFGIYHVYDFYQQLQQKLRLEHELRQLALQGELAALKAQLNPHFLYNTFNAISASLPPEQERTRELIAKLADLFRYQLQASKTDRVLLADEVNFVEKYLSLEKARLGNRLKVDIEIEEQLKQVRIPPMLIQPLVENAIIHGISPKIEGGTIKIKIIRAGDEIRFNITDTGIGLQENAKKNGSGIGLHNTRERLKKLFDSELTMSPLDKGGLAIQFAIPLKELETV